MHRNDWLIPRESKSLQIFSESLVAEEIHFGHFGVEELGDRFLGRFHRDVADVESTRLAGEGSDGRTGSYTTGGRREGRVVSESAHGRRHRRSRLTW